MGIQFVLNLVNLGLQSTDIDEREIYNDEMDTPGSILRVPGSFKLLKILIVLIFFFLF